MSYVFGPSSRQKLKGVHPDLIQVVTKGLELMDLVILGGVRTLRQQRIYVKQGLSKTMDSKHLIQPSGFAEALDLAPYPNFDWESERGAADLLMMGGGLLAVAWELGIRIRYGGDWNGNWRNSDNGFQDLDHIELVHGN